MHVQQLLAGDDKLKRILGSLALSRLCVSSACFVLAAAVVPAHAVSIAAFSFTSATFATIDPDTAELGYDFTTGSDPILVSAPDNAAVELIEDGSAELGRYARELVAGAVRDGLLAAS